MPTEPEQKVTRHSQDNREHDREARAARTIQRAWRRRNNKATMKYMTSEARWRDAALHAKFKLERTDANKGKNSSRERWQRAGFYASRLRDENEVLNKADGSLDSNADVQKHLETQHWLELVDGLDQGEGKKLSLPECPREQLEKERIMYLSAEQRLNYLATVDEEGKLRWARNNELIDTSAGHWKDAGNGGGIVPDDLPDRPISHQRDSFETSSSSSSSSSEESNAAMHYAGPPKGKNRWSRAFHKYFTVKGLLDRMLRKTVRRNTWIYVTDKNYNLFIGIKDTGTFQHSSFLGGGLVTAAGLISVRAGLVHTLSPLSGHYRTTVEHFHRFLDVMAERGVDLHKAKISKAEAALWGIEHIAKWKKKESELKKAGKQKVSEAGRTIAHTFTSEDSSWKKEILEGRRKSNNGAKESTKEEDQHSER
ncbi:hypothetical protein VKT23_003306 [Stygiomarasmius scandens]|uniref:Uncharacterized protein n=1 Tax=Marasmiellus scandens TaxID=2682957 RepID=A0ABR1JXA9_9AGAR